MKIAVLGNSHVSMLKAASTRPAFNDHTFTWMARHTPGSDAIEISGTTIVDQTRGRRRVMAPGLVSEMDVAEFDALVIAGNTILYREVALLCRTHFVTAWVGNRRANAIIASAARRKRTVHPMTEAAFRAVICSRIQGNFTYKWAARLHDVCEIPVFIVPPVFAREIAVSTPANQYEALKDMANLNVSDHLARVFNAAHADAFDELERVSVVHQAESTIIKDFFTKEAFAYGAVWLDDTKTYKKDDVVHGNADLGEVVLSEVIRRYAQASATSCGQGVV